MKREKSPTSGPVLPAAAALLICCATTAAADECPISAKRFRPDPEATSIFLEKSCTWATTGRNPFLILEPGYQIVLESDEERTVITVLDDTRVVDGVRTRVVEEREFEKDGAETRIVERSLNYYAICRQTNSVFYFGEDVEDFDENGNVISSEGEWHAGENGARPGIVMPGTQLVGGKYYEEIAPEDSALDKAEIVALRRRCEAGDFEFRRFCLVTEGTSDCDPDAEERKVYVKNVGIVVDEEQELVDFGFVDD
jgi:hypothetical protein